MVCAHSDGFGDVGMLQMFRTRDKRQCSFPGFVGAVANLPVVNYDVSIYTVVYGGKNIFEEYMF